MAGTVLALASQDVKLTPEDRVSGRLAGQILRELNRRKLRLDPDRIELREAVCRALSEPNGTNGLRVILRRVDAGSYREFVGVLLPRLLVATVTPGDHRKVLLSMAVDCHLKDFSNAYAAFLQQRPRDSFDKADVAALVFWLRLGEFGSAWPVLGRMKGQAIDAMATRFCSMGRKTRAKARVYLQELPALREPGLRDALGAFLDEADALRPSWLDRLLGRRRT